MSVKHVRNGISFTPSELAIIWAPIVPLVYKDVWDPTCWDPDNKAHSLWYEKLYETTMELTARFLMGMNTGHPACRMPHISSRQIDLWKTSDFDVNVVWPPLPQGDGYPKSRDSWLALCDTYAIIREQPGYLKFEDHLWKLSKCRAECPSVAAEHCSSINVSTESQPVDIGDDEVDEEGPSFLTIEDDVDAPDHSNAVLAQDVDRDSPGTLALSSQVLDKPQPHEGFIEKKLEDGTGTAAREPTDGESDVPKDYANNSAADTTTPTIKLNVQQESIDNTNTNTRGTPPTTAEPKIQTPIKPKDTYPDQQCHDMAVTLYTYIV